MNHVIESEALGSVVEQAATGDEAAFARIVAAYDHDMARVCFVVCGNGDLARDAVQAAWTLAWRKLRTVRDPDRVRSWLISVAANEARQLVRRRGRRAVVEIAVVVDAHILTRTTDPGDRAGVLDLSNALSRLSVEDRMVVAMRYAVGLSSSEIGQALGMTGGGVRARLARILDRLRKDLGDA